MEIINKNNSRKHMETNTSMIYLFKLKMLKSKRSCVIGPSMFYLNA